MGSTFNGSEKMTITDNNGRAYTISETAAEALRSAKTADVADAAFELHAPHVPAMSRCAVWFAV